MPTELPIVCTLSGSDSRARAVAVRELGNRALVGVEAHDGRALLRFHGERERVEGLVAAESQCCAFFQFAVTRDGEKIDVEIRTPEGGEPLLRALVAAIVAGWEGPFG
jgi:MerR family transcriptional regulator, copper efflux regulator